MKLSCTNRWREREVLPNRPDIIFKKKDKICFLIDVTIPSNRNVLQKQAEKELKYKNKLYNI
jgi:hypothetical protein